MKDRLVSITNILYILVYFIYRSRAPFPAYELYNITLMLEIISILICFTIYYNTTIVKNILGYLFLYLVLLLHFLAVNISSSIVLPLNVSLIFILRQSVYFYLTFIFAKYIYRSDKFIKYFTSLSITSLIILLSLYLLDIEVLGGYAYGVFRPILFLSEPSAWAPIVAYIMTYGLYKKKYYLSALALFSIFYINSGTTIIVSMAVLSIYYVNIFRGKWMIPLFVLLIILIPLILNSSIMNLHAITRIDAAISTFSIEDHVMGQSRIVTLSNIASYLNRTGTLAFGTGFNTSRIIHPATDDYDEFSTLHLVLHSFGLSGIVIYMFVILFAFILLMKKYVFKEIHILYLAFVFASITNSAEGAILFKFHFMIIVLLFLNIEIYKSTKYVIKEEFQ